MDTFNISSRYQLLRVWLIAMACQTGHLFSLLHSSSHEDSVLKNSEQTWFMHEPMRDNEFTYPSLSSFPYDSYSQNHELPIREGLNSEQINEIIQPNRFFENDDQNQPFEIADAPYYPVNNSQPLNIPQNGQWPAFSNNGESNPLILPPPSDSHQDFIYPSFTQPKGEYSEWNADTSTPSFWFNETLPNTSISTSEFENKVENLDKKFENFTTFHLLEDSSHPKEDHPLSEEGHAASYPFPESDGEEVKEFISDRKSDTSDDNKILNSPESTPNLSQGKGQVKFVKKASKDNWEKDSSEYIIGKKIIVDPAVGVIDQLSKSSTKIEEKELSEPYLTQSREQSLDFSSLKPISSDAVKSVAELIAQTTTNESSRNPVTPEPSLETQGYLNLQEIERELVPPTSNPSPSLPSPPLLPEATPSSPRPPTIITPTSPSPTPTHSDQPQSAQPLKEISINFNNVAMIEYIRFISRISNKNFIFDDDELQFNVTVVSEEPTTVENLMTALLQELKIRDLALIEQGNNIIIHRNPRVRSPARIVEEGTELISSYESELVTRVFRLNTLDPIKASEIIRPLLSEDALVEVLRDTNNLIITDLVSNVNKIAQLIGTLDAPNSGITIGQFVVRNGFVDSLVDLASKILQPIAQGNPFVLVPHPVSNSIFIVSNAFIVEKALAILQNLDLNEGRTKILSLEGLRPSYPTEEQRPSPPSHIEESRPITPPINLTGPGAFGPGQRPVNLEGIPESFPFGEGPSGPLGPNSYPFPPGVIGAEGRPSAIFDEGREFLPGSIGPQTRWSRELPHGHIERTLFFIYKLRYRKGDQIEIALRKIGNSLQLMGTANADLIGAINSSQWIESSNALIFTGTAMALEKVRELILEVDIPLRQVFIEMLILDTTIADSLSYSVDWIDRFGGGTTTGEEGFLGNPAAASTFNFRQAVETILPSGQTVPPSFASPLPVATGFLNSAGFAAGIIGTHLTHGGTRFSTIGALVRAIHTDTKANILLNPKIITEDNNTAEIFVGGTDRYKTQSITNDLGTLVTNNFQFIDVGTTLRVTPLIGNNGIISLEIIQETTSPSANANAIANAVNQDVNLVEVLTKTRTVTKVHVPNGFFVVLSGMIQDNETRSYSRIPCLGGIPIIGAFGKTQGTTDNKRNLMLFIRPFIIDTDEDLEDVTRRQQDVYREKSKFRRAWNYEIDESLNFLNIKPTDPDEIGCNER